MQGPVPDQFNLVVTDMDATVAFYQKLGGYDGSDETVIASASCMHRGM